MSHTQPTPRAGSTAAKPDRAGACVQTAPQGCLGPEGAAGLLDRWKQALSAAEGAYPGGALDAPGARLALLKIFGDAPRLAHRCLAQPAAAAVTLQNGPADAIDRIFQDLADLDGGVGDPETLHKLLAPIRDRMEVVLGVAFVMGALSVEDMAKQRTRLAERFVGVALDWLLRAGVAREELPADRFVSVGGAEVFRGVFALAGGAFATGETPPGEKLDLAILYEAGAFKGKNASLAERAFVRMSQEFHTIFDGKGGVQPLFGVATPFGAGATGVALIESIERTSAAVAGEQETTLRRFLMGARPIGGDRTAAGAFLEGLDAELWPVGATTAPSEPEPVDGDTLAELRAFLRAALGAHRPAMRTAPMARLLGAAGERRVIAPDRAARLAAGDGFSKTLGEATFMTAGAAATPTEQDKDSISHLMGFGAFESVEALLSGFRADQKDTLSSIRDGARAAAARYGGVQSGEAAKLSALGFRDASMTSAYADAWAQLACEERFAATAPGFLTLCSTVQRPDRAIALFDRLLHHQDVRPALLKLASEDGPARRRLVDGLGSVDDALAPLADRSAGAQALIAMASDAADKAVTRGDQWLTRFGAPADGTPVDNLAAWRREAIATIAGQAVMGLLPFSVAADALAAVRDKTIECVSAHILQDQKAASLSMYVMADAGDGLPGAPVRLGFLATPAAGGCADAAQTETAAQSIVEALANLDGGFFSMPLNPVRRSAGEAGALAPDAARLKAHLQSEAVAHDQILMARLRVVGGGAQARLAGAKALRSAVANPKRADILLRDLDRARAQRMRSNAETDPWSVVAREGGLADVELIIATLVYRHGGALPALQTASARDALSMLVNADLVDAQIGARLTAAHAFWRGIAAAQALTQWSHPKAAPVRPRFADILARAGNVSTFDQIMPLMQGHAEEIGRIYAHLVLGRPLNGFARAG